jgi:type II secretory pathway component PulC
VRLTKIVAVVLAGLLGVTTLWVADFNPKEWLHALTPTQPVLRATPHPETRAVVVQPRPLGTDSSVSPVALVLHLVATRLGRNAREGYADIGVDVHSPQTYRAGGLLANGVRIEEVHADYVILSREGQSTRLYVEGHAPPGYEPLATAAGLIHVGGTSPRAVAVADTTEALTDVIRVSPLFDGPTFKGLQVYGNERSDAFARLGLEPGDVIHSIDGEPVRDPASAIASLRHLTEGHAVMVEVERAGQLKALSLDGTLFVAARGS